MFRLSKLSDYAIVLLTYMARDKEATMFTARDLAEQSQVPLATVGKILKALSRAGLLVSHRGVRGGYSLGRPAASITVSMVMRSIDGHLSLTDCSADAPGLCEYEPKCPVRSNWQIINHTVLSALDQLSLAEMTTPLAARPLTPWATPQATPRQEQNVESKRGLIVLEDRHHDRCH